MYLPARFREERPDVQYALIHAHPLGLVVTNGASGLNANPIPFVAYPSEGAHGTLRAHLSRGNAQWQELATGQECLVVFQGPHEYITPSWYPSKQEDGKVVPTWNFTAVHIWGTPRIVEDAAWLRRQLEDLTRSREGGRPAPWAVGDAPASHIEKEMRGIIGVEIPVTRIEGKWKVSQNQSEANRNGVVQGLRTEAGADNPMAALVAAYGKAP